MSIRIETPEGVEELTEFVAFHDQVYAARSVRWPALTAIQLPLLRGPSPFREDRTIRPFAAREDGAIVARAAAVVDARYNRHWNERLGHVLMFEARPEARDATRLLMDAVSDWLAGEGVEAARAGFGPFEFPFALDDYDSLPPSILRQNPAYYHALLKDAGFETERGWVDYKIAVTPDLRARWESALEAARRAGFAIVPLRDVPAAEQAPVFTALWNDAFKRHWGFSPFTAAEIDLLLKAFAPVGGLDVSVFAYRGTEPVGVLWVVPETTALAKLAPGRVLRDDERLNFLGIGVAESARGRGVNLAMAAYAYLELARRGARHVSYTLVLDDNWPSRRTAEKLGASVCANYVVYRRNFRR
jgi:GNAT superfamily N-acetyltransferase